MKYLYDSRGKTTCTHNIIYVICNDLYLTITLRHYQYGKIMFKTIVFHCDPVGNVALRNNIYMHYNTHCILC